MTSCKRQWLASWGTGPVETVRSAGVESSSAWPSRIYATIRTQMIAAGSSPQAAQRVAQRSCKPWIPSGRAARLSAILSKFVERSKTACISWRQPYTLAIPIVRRPTPWLPLRPAAPWGRLLPTRRRLSRSVHGCRAVGHCVHRPPALDHRRKSLATAPPAATAPTAAPAGSCRSPPRRPSGQSASRRR